MAILTSISTFASSLGMTIGLMDLDINGFLLSQQFLSAVANAISSVLIGLFSLLFLGTPTNV